MRLIVLYREDGRIVSLSRTEDRTGPDDQGVPPLRHAVAPLDGQRSAIVDVDPAWGDLPLSEIHQRFVVVHKGREIRLRQRAR